MELPAGVAYAPVPGCSVVSGLGATRRYANDGAARCRRRKIAVRGMKKRIVSEYKSSGQFT
jgi:hypothetical protein